MAYEETDTDNFFDDSCPIDDEGIGRRIGEMESHAGGPKKMHEKTGISLSQLNRLQKGSIPKFDALLKMVKAGYCAEWVLTGRGAMRYEDAQSAAEKPAAALDAANIETLALASSLIAEACITEQVPLPIEVRTELTKGLYSIHQSVGTPLTADKVRAFIRDYKK